MGTYSFIPIIALFCYIFLFMTMLAAKKDRTINAFMLVLGCMILWTGGSFLMRMQMWPNVKFWYDVSNIGLYMLGYAFFNYAFAFVGCKKTFWKHFWFLTGVLMNVINISTGFFLRYPETVYGAGGEVAFVYTPTWRVAFLFVYCAAVIAHMFALLFRYMKRSEIPRRQFTPVLLGIFILFAGHVLFILPFFQGFPTDILSGLLNAFCMFYALYRRRLFKLTLLVSRGSCYVLSAGLSVLIFSNLFAPMEHFITTHMTAFAQYNTLIVALVFALSIFLIYFILKKFIDSVFVREDIARAEKLKEFSLAASKSLHVDEILSELVDVISRTISVQHVYVCIPAHEGAPFQIARSSSPLDDRSFSLPADSPIALWLQEHNECLLMSDFRWTVAYKSMWEQEKKQIADLGIECFVPLKDEKSLVGIVLLSAKEKNAAYTYDDISFLSSVDSIGSIAVKNSHLYERAYLEARTDELTGLFNRKYFGEILRKQYQKCRSKNQSLALIILNVDDFKLYNQLYGNREGDIALQRVARIIRACVGENGFVARYSGKEFAVILPYYNLMAARDLAENIRRQILAMNKSAEDYTLKVLTVSGGVCSIPYAASNLQQLIDNADMAVYHVKRSGKNAIKVYTNGNSAVQRDPVEESPDKQSIYSEYANTIYALTAAIDTKDHYTFNHSKNVAYYATELATAAGLNPDHIEMVREAALLHDVGKIGIPEHVLNKPGRLTGEEYAIMKGHVENSIGIIRHLPSLDYVIPAVIGHHERYDGHGYPRRIAGEDIPLSARILGIADAFDAMMSRRAYKEPYPVARALDILDQEAGRQFDPQLAPLFIQLVKSGRIQVHSDAEPEY
nr:HD domain-containing phosphohydrolase [Maliibacterium massiliense]